VLAQNRFYSLNIVYGASSDEGDRKVAQYEYGATSDEGDRKVAQYEYGASSDEGDREVAQYEYGASSDEGDRKFPRPLGGTFSCTKLALYL
jgi:hypothetical protein